MAKNTTTAMNFVKDNGNTAVAEVLKDGKVDMTITTPGNITVIRHFDNLDKMVDETNSLGYNKVM